jgi:hypothetical protein
MIRFFALSALVASVLLPTPSGFVVDPSSLACEPNGAICGFTSSAACSPAPTTGDANTFGLFHLDDPSGLTYATSTTGQQWFTPGTFFTQSFTPGAYLSALGGVAWTGNGGLGAGTGDGAFQDGLFLTLNSDFTIQFAVHLNSTPTGTGPLFSDEFIPFGTRRFGVFVQSDLGVLVSWTCGGYRDHVVPGLTIPVGVTTDLAFVKSTSAGVETVLVYKNGAYVASVSDTASCTGGPSDGCLASIHAAGAPLSIDGWIDEFEISNVARGAPYVHTQAASLCLAETSTY